MHDDLLRVSEWAKARLRAGGSPPWTHQRLLQLAEAADALRAGMDLTQPTADLQPPAPHPDVDPSPAGEVLRLDSARRRRGAVPVRLPT
jgi:hypothetical protein